jgi:hypothetical protein
MIVGRKSGTYYYLAALFCWASACLTLASNSSKDRNMPNKAAMVLSLNGNSILLKDGSIVL